MKHIPRSAVEIVQNSDSCEVTEFGGIESIDGADVAIDGRYPVTNYALNEKSDMVIRVLSGAGRITTRDIEVMLEAGDVAFVGKGEAYYFEGQNLKLFMACTSAWSSEQYSGVE
jgi:mannose-6-phosphate isomerase-like protein (cupin superfamily)